MLHRFEPASASEVRWLLIYLTTKGCICIFWTHPLGPMIMRYLGMGMHLYIKLLCYHQKTKTKSTYYSKKFWILDLRIRKGMFYTHIMRGKFTVDSHHRCHTSLTKWTQICKVDCWEGGQGQEDPALDERGRMVRWQSIAC